PIYEFRCDHCHRRTSVFTRGISGSVEAVCSHCSSTEMSRLISRVAVLRSGDDMFSGLDESSLADIDENDPRSMARWVRSMSRQMGEPLDAKMETDLDRMEAGEMPEDVGEDGDGAEDEFAQEFGDEE
ncbi:MAG: zinc ribbon domain-containing protein, partial [Dehalococcoidia bacterium]